MFGGVGWGLGYMSPVSTMQRWFPDKRGLATGLALSAFGAGAALAAPVIQDLCNTFFVAPTFVGPECDVTLVLKDAIQYVRLPGSSELQEVVVASVQDVAKLPGAVREGVYLVRLLRPLGLL